MRPDPGGGGDIDLAPPPIQPPPRPHAEPAAEGLRVILRRIPNLTPPGLLEVPFLFQVPPLEEFQEEFAFNQADFMTGFAGERSRAAGPQLATWSWNTMFLADLPSWSLIQNFVPHPILIKRELRQILNSGKPVQLIAHQLPLWDHYDVNSAATMRSLNSGERAGEPDARYFSMQFREYRPLTVKTRLKGRGRARGSQRGSHATSLLVRTLHANRSTLYKLAIFYYGAASKWRDIQAVPANGLAGVAPDQDLRVVFRRFRSKKITIPAVQSETYAANVSPEDDIEVVAQEAIG